MANATVRVTIDSDAFQDELVNLASLVSANPWLKDEFSKQLDALAASPENMMHIPDANKTGYGALKVLPSKMLVELVAKMHARVRARQ